MELAGVPFRRQVPIKACYKSVVIGEYRIDLVVDESVIVELKCVARFDPVFTAQLLTYLRMTKKRVGLLVNFGRETLVSGIKRVIL